jgi:hypothetical protein
MCHVIRGDQPCSGATIFFMPNSRLGVEGPPTLLSSHHFLLVVGVTTTDANPPGTSHTYRNRACRLEWLEEGGNINSSMMPLNARVNEKSNIFTTWVYWLHLWIILVHQTFKWYVHLIIDTNIFHATQIHIEIEVKWFLKQMSSIQNLITKSSKIGSG